MRRLLEPFDAGERDLPGPGVEPEALRDRSLVREMWTGDPYSRLEVDVCPGPVRVCPGKAVQKREKESPNCHSAHRESRSQLIAAKGFAKWAMTGSNCPP